MKKSEETKELPEGLYESVLNNLIDRLLENTNIQKEIEKMDVEESSKFLSAYVNKVLNIALNQIELPKGKGKNKELLSKRIEICNEIIALLISKLDLSDLNDFSIIPEGKILYSVFKNSINNKSKSSSKLKKRPISPMSESSLFTGTASDEPSLISEFKKEILSSNKIYFLVSFIRWSGLRQILKELREFCSHPENKLRIITTTYMGATELKSIKELAKLPNTKIKISYDTQHTRLHAKSYMFIRNTKFSTIYIGSSNLSNFAVSSGLEWNIKLSEYDSEHIFHKSIATFESYWNDNEFRLYSKEQEEFLKLTLNSTSITSHKQKKINDIDHKKMFEISIKPYYFQKEILDKLEVERNVYGRRKNLIVAATGTGKTIISAFDYARFKKNSPNKNNLLFVAHRKEILEQSIDCYRHVLKDENFANQWDQDHNPNKDPLHLTHLFASIQTLNSRDIYSNVPQDFFDYIVVDEFHHGAASSYQELIEYFEPKIFLGLTATPERMDGKSIVDLYFEGFIAAELRLYNAVKQKLLSPFHYFVVTDPVDLRTISWKRGGYDKSELEEIYLENKMSVRRANVILNAVKEYTSDINSCKAIGFCVSKKHAKFMADFFNNLGYKSQALDSDSPREVRDTVKNKLKKLEINFVFVVDLFNEGVDIPEIDAVLFLRPTESLRIFIQQLGRGLRLSEGKDSLTVLDFVGHHDKHYKISEKIRALIGKTNRNIKDEIKEDFPDLPPGCSIQMEEKAQEYILENIKNSVINMKSIKKKISNFQNHTTQPLTLTNFLNFNQIELKSLYSSSKNENLGWNRLLVQVGLLEEFEEKNQDHIEIAKGIRRLIRCNSGKFLRFIKQELSQSSTQNENNYSKAEKIFLLMFHYTIFQESPKKMGLNNYSDIIKRIQNNQLIAEELIEVISYHLDHNLEFVHKEIQLQYICPLEIHAQYILDQILAAMEMHTFEKKASFREGVKYLKDKNTDILFITLNKAEKDYSPSTLYKDYAISEKLFHWQSQSTTDAESATGERYISTNDDDDDDYNTLLFVRRYKDGGRIAAPYYFLGKGIYNEHEGTKPINITWELEEKLPAKILIESNKLIS